LTNKTVDLRSDTVTQPTTAMRAAMLAAAASYALTDHARLPEHPCLSRQ
jgi:hypothetical protein